MTVDVFIGIHIMLWIVAWLFGFSAGQYTCKDGKNRSCLVYVGFNHKIYVYYKVELERMESTNLLKVLEEKSEFKGHLKELGVGKCTGNSWKGQSGQTGASLIMFNRTSTAFVSVIGQEADCVCLWSTLPFVKPGLWPECQWANRKMAYHMTDFCC